MTKQLWPIFVISLKDKTARRQAMQKQMADHALAFEFFDAVDGRKALSPEDECRIDRQASRRLMSDAEYACALSHLDVYQLILDRGLAGAIILEDDALLQPNFTAFMQQRLYEHAGLILFDHVKAFRWRWARAKILLQGISGYRVLQSPKLATGYSISSRLAAHILSQALPVRQPADWPIDISCLDHLVCTPRLIHSADEAKNDSDIEGARKPLRQHHQAHGKTKGLARFFGLFNSQNFKRKICARFWR